MVKYSSIKHLDKHLDSTNVRNKEYMKKFFSLLVEVSWKIWPVVTEKIVLRLFFSPVEYKLNAAEKRLLQQGDIFFIKVRNKKIQCWRWGEGPLVILAHGWNGRGIQFQPLIEALIDSGFSVVTYDAPGHGESEGKTSNYFEFSDAVRSLWHTVDKNNVQAVIGHSLGACALLNFISKENYHRQTILIAPALKLREMLFQTFEIHGVPKIVYQNLVQNLESLHGYSIFSDNPSQLIKQIHTDLVVFHDKNDKAVPYADMKHVAEVSNNIHLNTTTGLGHKRILFDRKVIQTIVRNVREKNTIKTDIQKAS
jgi:predicted alpha/beta-fold hydrolase